MDPVKRRPYRSRLRADGARRTRRAIVDAARALFLERGYAATSLEDVASAAGVARPTVFAAFGSKAAVLRQVLDEALAGDDEPLPVARRPWFEPVWEATDPRSVLDAYAGVCTLIGQRAAAVFEVVRRAADSAPEVSQLWGTLQRNRRAGAQMVVDHLVTRGPLRPGVEVSRAVDILWVLNDPALFGALVGACGWPPEAFRVWLRDQMVASLIGGPDEQRAGGPQ